MKHLILASASPRRHELLKMIIPVFDIATGLEVDESWPDDMIPDEVPVYLSRIKAWAYSDRVQTQNDVLITADTVVIVDDDILGKPSSRDEAIEMLTRLSGRSHRVVTGLTLTTLNGSHSLSQCTIVHFDTVPYEDIIHYVDTYRPYDKAGAYGIQEWIGAAAIKGIEGSFYNVMGLPVHALFKALRKLGLTQKID